MLILLRAALAAGLDDHFPPTPLSPADVEAMAASFGAPARSFDPVGVSPSAATPEEAAAEALLRGDRRVAPDSLRRWGRIMLTLSEKGKVPPAVAWFVAEHVGLPTMPLTLSYFVASPDPEVIRDLVAEYAADAEVQCLAVVLAPIPGSRSMRGLVVGMAGDTEFEAFPRVWMPGDVASVPGTRLRRKENYALYVTGPGAEVKTYAIPGTEGRFDIDIPLPTEPGAYRVAMNAQKRRGFPDSSFFFTLYVGQEPPPLPVFDGAKGSGDLLARLNVERERYGLPRLEAVGRPETIQALLSSMPPTELGQWRAFRAFSKTDPAPDVPHGSWDGVSTTQADLDHAAWTISNHPVSRQALLDPAARYALLGQGQINGAPVHLGILMHPAASAEEVDRRVEAMFRERFATAPTRGRELEALMLPIAEKVAAGTLSLEAALARVKKEVRAAMKAGRIRGSAGMAGWSWPIDGEWSLGQLTVPPDAAGLALAATTGAQGGKDGVRYAVVLSVVAGGID